MLLSWTHSRCSCTANVLRNSITCVYRLLFVLECVYLFFIPWVQYFIRRESRGPDQVTVVHRPRSITVVTYFRFFNGCLTKSYNAITIRKLLLRTHCTYILLLRLSYIRFIFLFYVRRWSRSRIIHITLSYNTCIYIYKHALNANRPWIYLFPCIHVVCHRRKNCKWPLNIIITTPQQS